MKKVVYFVLAPETNRVKIGVTSRDPEQRLAGMQVGSSERLEVILNLDCRPPFEEKQLHRRFRGYRLHGEWFEYTGDLKKFVESKRFDPKPTSGDDFAVAETLEEERTSRRKEQVEGALRDRVIHRKQRDGLPKIEGYPSERGILGALRYRYHSMLPTDIWTCHSPEEGF